MGVKLIIELPTGKEILEKYGYYSYDLLYEIQQGILSDKGHATLYAQVKEAIKNEQFLNEYTRRVRDE